MTRITPDTGHEIRWQRMEANVCRDALAREVGRPVSTISAWERGDTRSMTEEDLAVIARYLHIDRQVLEAPANSATAAE